MSAQVSASKNAPPREISIEEIDQDQEGGTCTRFKQPAGPPAFQSGKSLMGWMEREAIIDANQDGWDYSKSRAWNHGEAEKLSEFGNDFSDIWKE